MNCEKHRGGVNHLEKLMRELPENQGGDGRHRCPYCAYERGVIRGRELERRQIADALGVEPDEISDLGSSSK